MKKNKNRGFTLIELLAVVTLLGILALITIPVITDTMSKNKEKLYYDQLNQLIRASQNWGTDNIAKLSSLNNKCGNTYTITLDQLKNKTYNSSINAEQYVSYIDDDFKNPKTQSPFSNSEISVNVYKQGKNYLYCVQMNGCNEARFDEYKDIASNICCTGDTFKSRLEGCILGR